MCEQSGVQVGGAAAVAPPTIPATHYYQQHTTLLPATHLDLSLKLGHSFGCPRVLRKDFKCTRSFQFVHWNALVHLKYVDMAKFIGFSSAADRFALV